MPKLTSADFERIDRRIRESTDNLAISSPESIKVLKRELPSEDALMEYMLWSSTRLIQQQPKPAIPPAREYVSNIMTANFSRNGDIAHITELLDLPAAPYIGLGYYNRIPYRLSPNPHVLTSDKEPDFDAIDDELLPEAFLGVNFNVEPPRRDFLPGESFGSATSDNDDTTGFVFFQLGHLEWYPHNWEKAKATDLISSVWKETGFVVGVKLSRAGILGGIYIFFNFNPEDDLTSERVKYQDDNWGHLPNATDQKIACACIASDFAALGHNKEFRLEEVHQVVPEYVRVIKRADGNILRQTVLNE